MSEAAKLARPPGSGEGPLAIICGGGSLPYAVAEAAKRKGRSVFLLAIEGWADATSVAQYPHAWIVLGRFGRVLELARSIGFRDVVFIGTLLRPAFRSIRLDWTTLRLLPRAYRLFRGGDDHLLSGVARTFEDHGFRMLGAHEVAPEILVPAGPLGARRPSADELSVAEHGFAVIDAMGPFDVGQAAVVAGRRVLALEAAEGTDNMLLRIADLRAAGRIRIPEGTGLLVKAAKPGQDRRIDLPSIGPSTIEGVRRAALAGIVLRAGEVIVAQMSETVAAADQAGIFVAGLAPRRPERPHS